VIGWVSGWREATLRAAGIPISQFALDALAAWNKSTPVVPATYNPLGMPAKGTSNVSYLATPYALFTGIGAFTKAMSAFLSTSKGAELAHALNAAESLSDVYRAIHALGWPAAKTETDYPSALLDMLEASYRAKMATRTPANRKTSGIVQAPPAVHTAVRQQARVLHHAAINFSDASKAISHIVKGLG
jgi:hypothetical protein